MDFVTLYSTELTRALGSSKTDLFTTARRKAAINAAQLEWVRRTECFQRQASVALVDGTQEYDIEASLTDFGWITKQGLSIKIVDGTTTTYIEGDDLMPLDAFVCNAIKLSHFTAVKMSHSGLVFCSLFSEILIV